MVLKLSLSLEHEAQVLVVNLGSDNGFKRQEIDPFNGRKRGDSLLQLQVKLLNSNLQLVVVKSCQWKRPRRARRSLRRTS